MSVLRKLFGPSRDIIWSQIANDIGADYRDGGFWERDYISYQHGEWEIILDTYTQSTGKSSVTYTRMRAPFVNRDSLYFKIYRAGFFSNMGKYFGMQDIEIGDEYFDKDFVIKGNDQLQVARLLVGDDIKALIERHPKIHFEIRDDEGIFTKKYPEGVDELYFQCVGVLKNQARIKDLFDLFAFTLERLVAIDSAYAHDPNGRFV